MNWSTQLRLREDVSFDSLMLFFPNPAHWEWLFAVHSAQEWALGSALSLWDLKIDTVLYADGVHTLKSIRAKGKPLEKWLGVPEAE